MSIATTYTASNTTTYTYARAKYVMGKAYEDILALYFAEIITKDRADKWKEDILYILEEQAMSYFEIQIKRPGKEKVGFRYKLSYDGTIYTDNESGGTDYYSLPKGTKASLFVSLDVNSKNYSKVNEELENRGWGSNGKPLEGSHEQIKSYSKDGYGFNIKKVGEW